MADAANKYPENVPGKFYVYKQPETPDEEGLCKEAMEGCPVEAIGSDGNGA